MDVYKLALVILFGFFALVNSQDPGNWPSCQGDAVRSPSITDTGSRVAALRSKMVEKKIEAYIVPSADFHLSEFTSAYDQRRYYISGFSGSAGTAVITNNKTALWTDGRYFLQAEAELGCDWILMREGEQGTPDLTDWVAKQLGGGQKVGASPLFFSSETWLKYSDALRGQEIVLEGVNPDLIDSIWTDGRMFPNTPINALPLKYSGKTWQDKLSDVYKSMEDHGADVLILTGLDEIAWLFNARATDISGFVSDPFFYSFAIIQRGTNPNLFIVDKKLKLTEKPTDPATTVSLADHWNTRGNASCTGKISPCVKVDAYDPYNLQEVIRRKVVTYPIKRIWVSYHCNYAVFETIPASMRYVANTPPAMMKAQKNAIEIQGMTNCHRKDEGVHDLGVITRREADALPLAYCFPRPYFIMSLFDTHDEGDCWNLDEKIRDAVALARFASKLERTLKEGKKWTELSAMKELSRFRSMQTGNRGDSFAAISSVGPNAAINHYFVTETTDRPITLNETYLLDSGGQYLDGTTDVTRTFFFSEPDDFLKECYTRVLMGQIDLAQAVWDKGRYGREIDAFARKALWDVGLVYRHGTGHGIGAYLSVHEGPGRISNHHPLFVWDVPLDEHMFFSDEPGYYESGKFGIRLENIIYVKKVETKFRFPGATMLGMETITLFPYEPHLIDFSLLTNKQIKWFNEYNKQIRDKVAPLIREQEDNDAYEWLMKRTDPVERVVMVTVCKGVVNRSSLVLVLLVSVWTRL